MALHMETQWADIAYYSAGDVLSSAVFYIACAAGPPLTSCSGRNSFFEWFQSTVECSTRSPLFFCPFLSLLRLLLPYLRFLFRLSSIDFLFRSSCHGKTKASAPSVSTQFIASAPMINVSIECHSPQSMNVPET